MMRADVAFEDADTYCPCGKRHQIDIGADVFGRGAGVVFCPHCGPIPQAADWESRATGLRNAIATVIAARGASS